MKAELEMEAKGLHDKIRMSLRSDKHASVVTILSLHDDAAGQWIIGDPHQDPKRVAARLRVCANLLDKLVVTSGEPT